MSDPRLNNNVSNTGNQFYNPNQVDDDFEITGGNNISGQFNQENVTDDDFVITESTKPTGNESKKVDLKGAFVIEKFNLPEKTANTLNNIRQTKPSSGFFNALGRLILKVVNYFKGGVSDSSVLSIPDKIKQLREVEIQSPLPKPQKTNAEPYSMTTEQLSRLAGLGANTKIEPFGDVGANFSNLNNLLFGENSIPRLSDIKQNPDFQDCWFLSSITSVLSTQGPEAITRLFDVSDTPNHIHVRLGENTYDVPLGRIVDGQGNKFGSNSANWVVVLENAMLMHLAVSLTDSNINNVTAKTLKMAYRSAGEGLNALLGCSMKHQIHTRTLPMSSNELLSVIRENLNKHLPVVIGHQSKATALSDGISPGHAVTVLDIENDEKVVVLDPYGEVKKIPVSSLKNYTAATVIDYKEHQATVDRKEITGTEEVPEDENDGDDF